MSSYERTLGRAADMLRPVQIERGYTRHAEGSVLVSFGGTKVLCTASVEDKVPPHKRGSGQGWVTAEYGMLPRATHTRGDREAARGKQSGRTQEIQRLIGRSMRCVFDLAALDDRIVLVNAALTNFLFVDPATGAVKQLWAKDRDDQTFPGPWSRDGARMALLSYTPESSSLVTMDTSGNQVLPR